MKKTDKLATHRVMCATRKHYYIILLPWWAKSLYQGGQTDRLERKVAINQC